MQNKYEMLKNLEDQLGEFDDDLTERIEKIEAAYQGSGVPVGLRKKIQELVDFRKDYADMLQQLKWAADNSWEELEIKAGRMYQKLSQSIIEIREDYKD